MNEKQFAIFLEHNDRSTKEAVEKHVNGKIRALDEKLDQHILSEQIFREEVKPLLQGAAGLQLLWKVFVAVGSLAVAWVAIKGVFK